MKIKCNCGNKIEIEKIKKNEPIKVFCYCCKNETVINDTKALYIKYIALLVLDGFLMLSFIISQLFLIIGSNFKWQLILCAIGISFTCWKSRAVLRIIGSITIFFFAVYLYQTDLIYSNPKDFKINITQNEVTIIGNNIPDWNRKSMSRKVISIPPKIQKMKVTVIGESAFHGLKNITSVKIPKGVTSIGRGAFSWCTRLASVKIPSSVITIGSGAFSECKNLNSVKIPSSVTTIGSGAFRECTRLISVTIPDSVTTIGGSAFSECTSLISVTIPDSVMSIGYNAFSGWTSTQTINVPFANVYETPEGWDTNWNKNCNAIIKYWNGTTWE